MNKRKKKNPKNFVLKMNKVAQTKIDKPKQKKKINSNLYYIILNKGNITYLKF